jgi:DNA-binding HxlR family transcriptional regulator
MSEDILDILGKKHAMQTLLTIRELPGISMKDTTTIVNENNSSDRTVFLRIHDLINAGLVSIDQEERRHNIMHLYLTNKGQKVATLVNELAQLR